MGTQLISITELRLRLHLEAVIPHLEDDLGSESLTVKRLKEVVEASKAAEKVRFDQAMTEINALSTDGAE